MKKFQRPEDFDVNPELFHTDLSFLDCEYFLSEHLKDPSYCDEKLCEKPPTVVTLKRSTSCEVDKSTQKNMFDQSQSLFKDK